MKLMKKLKEIPKVVVLSTAILSAFAGCATSWQGVRKEFNPTGIERKVVLSTTAPNKKETREFDISNLYPESISDPYPENDVYNVQVQESLKKVNYQIKNTGVEKEFKEVLVEEREMNSVFPLFTVLGAVGGSCLGVITADSLFLEEDGRALAGIMGALGGAYLGLEIDNSFDQTETRRTETGATGTEISNKKSEEKILNEKLIYQNRPARNISVEFSGNGLVSKIYQTDNFGMLNISDCIESGNPSYFFREYSEEEEIIKRIKDISLVQQMKVGTRNLLMDELIESISPKEIALRLETKEKSNNANLMIKNASKTFNCEGYQLTGGDIYQVVREFVDEEINSRIKSLEFTVKDAISHMPINGANFELMTKAPSKSDLAGKYFLEELKDYAQRNINDYLDSQKFIERCPKTITFSVYTPSTIFVKVTHPEYRFVSGEVSIRNKDTDKVVYMVDKGSKIRIEEAGKESGRIE